MLTKVIVIAQKMKFSNKDFFSKCEEIFTEEILNEKVHFLCSVWGKVISHQMIRYILWIALRAKVTALIRLIFARIILAFFAKY